MKTYKERALKAMRDLIEWYENNFGLPGEDFCSLCEIYLKNIHIQRHGILDIEKACKGCPSNSINEKYKTFTDYGCMLHKTIPSYKNLELNEVTELIPDNIKEEPGKNKLRQEFWRRMHLTAKKFPVEYFQPSQSRKYYLIWAKLIESTEKEIIREMT